MPYPSTQIITKVLHFFYAPGCYYCEAAEPELRKFQRKSPSVLIVRHNFNFGQALAKLEQTIGWLPKGTPGYAFVVDGVLKRKHNGGLAYRDLIEFTR